MATIELEPAPPPSRQQVLLYKSNELTRAVAGTDDRLSLRTLLLLVIVGLAGASAPMPLALVGVVATVLLALDVARYAWRKK
jgi:hypothetical protein